MSEMKLFDRALRGTSRALGLVPGSVAGLVGRDRALNDRGQRLDPQLGLLIWLSERLGLLMGKGSVEAARASARRRFMLIGAPPVSVAKITDGVLDCGLAVRTYEQDAGAPTFVFLHGGGWAVGDLDTHDHLCRRLCVHAGWRVVSVDYPLAPEHPCPAPQEGVLAAFREIRAAVVAAGGDGARVAVGGDSAGGHLSAVLCHQLAAAGEAQPGLQVLIYPATDLRRLTASYRSLAQGYLLTAEDIAWFLEQYQPPDVSAPAVSPLLAPDLTGLAPAVVATAGFDPLRDEGEAYARRLGDAGVWVKHLDETAMVHGYAQLDGVLPGADAALGRLLDAVRVGGEWGREA